MMYLHVVNTAVEQSLRGKHVRIPPEGGVIGRSLDSMLCLPDNSCLISRRHALISPAGGVFRVTDLSSNGLILNDGHQSLGKGRSSPLHDGDLLTFPGYQVLVSRLADIPQGVHFVIPGRIKNNLVQGEFYTAGASDGQSGSATGAGITQHVSDKHHSGKLVSVLKTALGMGGGMHIQDLSGRRHATEGTVENTVSVSQEGIALFNKNALSRNVNDERSGVRPDFYWSNQPAAWSGYGCSDSGRTRLYQSYY